MDFARLCRTLGGVAALTLALSGSALASIIHVDFQYGIFQGLPRAVGYADFDSDKLLNPSNGYYLVPVRRMQMLITGSPADDGLYDENDFPNLFWDTAGITLDFAAEWVGQGSCWGDYPTGCGDFSFTGVLPAAAHFGLLLTDATGLPDNVIPLASARARILPEPGVPALLALAGLLALRRRGQARPGT